MKRKLFLNVLGVIALTVNLLPVSVMAAPQDTPGSVSSQPVEAWSSLDAVLPSWFTTSSSPSDLAAANVLPGWFTGLAQPPAEPPLAPNPQPLGLDIAEALLSVNVFGPAVASLGSPPGGGEVYTAVIRNTSSMTAYSVYLTATHQTYFIHDGGDQLWGDAGPITFNLGIEPGVITWTPSITLNLLPGQALTLSFNLCAACDAQSGQQMRVGIYYNADPAQPPVELNTGGMNITTGRGNLVLKKEPGI